MGLNPGDGGVLGGRQNPGAVLDGDDAIDHRIGARHHGADVAFDRAEDVKHRELVVGRIGDGERGAGEVGGVGEVGLEALLGLQIDAITDPKPKENPTRVTPRAASVVRRDWQLVSNGIAFSAAIVHTCAPMYAHVYWTPVGHETEIID